MSRNLTAAVIAEIEASGCRPVLFFEGYFTSGWVYLWSGVGTKSWNGQTWTGAGQLLTLTPIGESKEVVAQGAQFTLSGLPSSLLTSALGEVRQGNPIRVYQGFLNADDEVIADPYQTWEGRMDACAIEQDGETGTIVLSAESRLIDLHRSRERRYTHDDQQIEYPGDLGFEFVPGMQERNLRWGDTLIPV